MNFKEFVQLSRPVIGGGGGVHRFVRSLFDAILTDAGKDILDDYSDSSYRAYANGNMQITKIAKAMSPYLDPVEFASFIYQVEEAAQLELCERFKTHLPILTILNVGEEMADLFANIIREAAGTKRKSSTSPKDDVEPIETEVVDDEHPSGDSTESKKITVIQQQTNIVQNGENNFNLANNGTMNFNF